MELSWIYPYLDAYRELGIFFGSFFFGEAFIIATSFFTFERSWSVPEVFLLAFLGVTLADLFWFLSGRYLLSRSRYLQKMKGKHREFFERFERKKRMKKACSMVFFKFLYGMRIVTLLYLSAQRMAFWKFLVVDLIGSLIWLAALFLVGWAAWSGFDYILRAFQSVGYLFLFIILLVLSVKMGERWLANRYAKKNRC